MKNNDFEIIKNIIYSNGYQLNKSPCLLDPIYNGYVESSCFNLNNTSLSVEFHFFEKSSDVVNAVAFNSVPQPNYYFRQIAIGKIWLILKGEWANKNEIDALMDNITNKM
jgi:hypothetical protein